MNLSRLLVNPSKCIVSYNDIVSYNEIVSYLQCIVTYNEIVTYCLLGMTDTDGYTGTVIFLACRVRESTPTAMKPTPREYDNLICGVRDQKAHYPWIMI